MIAMFIKQGMKPPEVPVYVTKSALFVFQLFPFVTFQSKVSIYEPITKAVSIDLDLFGSVNDPSMII